MFSWARETIKRNYHKDFLEYIYVTICNKISKPEEKFKGAIAIKINFTKKTYFKIWKYPKCLDL